VSYYDEYEDGHLLIESEREDFGCCMRSRCLMPGLHYPNECHDVAMIQAMEAEATEDSPATPEVRP
jgi:hypothetical protein